MKKIIIIILVSFVLFGCTSKKTVEFCEGISPEGEGVNCGKKFSTGDITVLIKPESTFAVTKISINVYKKTKYKSEKIETHSLEVNPEEASANTNIYFYDEGDFTLEVFGNGNEKIAEGAVSIFDVY